MSDTRLRSAPVFVVGAGIMGSGIAQVAAQAGHSVRLFDTRDHVAAQARSALAARLEGLVAKGRLSAEKAAATLANIEPVDVLERADDARLVIEAIVEEAEAKRSLLRRLEAIVPLDCVLASNTSSLSITALANGLARPGRLVGMHFFNPVPLMKLVEVVSGLHTDPGVASAIHDLSLAWGKVPVHAKSTPGFIVNRIARPFYAETLALLLEGAAAPEVLDACLRGAGFRMGPCELMDLIGHDTNFAVTQSVYLANFYDKRYMPSTVQRDLVDAGLLGRKSGRGFYRYPEGAASLPKAVHAAPEPAAEVAVHGEGPVADWIERAVGAMDVRARRIRSGGWTGLQIDAARLMLTDGRCADWVARECGVRDISVFDRPMNLSPLARSGRGIGGEGSGTGTAAGGDNVLAYSVASTASERWCKQAPAWLAGLGLAPQRIADTPGLVVARTIAMLINEAADAVLQGVCSVEGANVAMKLGVNYPYGPFEWLDGWSVGEVVAVLDALDRRYRGERYRISPWLERQIR
jgi:3-hydroxybutyryl-CoA dehydrogenase